MSFISIHNRIFKAAASLLVPAILIVGANFIANSKIDVEATSFHTTTLKKVVIAAPTVIFEADEEFDDDSLSDSNLLVSELPALPRVLLTKELIITLQFYDPLYQIEYSLNPRAPPALKQI